MRIARKMLVVAILAAVPAFPAWAQDAELEALKAQMKALSERINVLESRNKALEKALDSEYMRDADPEIASRVKILESQTAELRENKGITEALKGVVVEGSLMTVAQGIGSSGTIADKSASELNWRGDLTIEAPAGESGTTTGKVFAHLRAGQGDGLTPKLNSTYTGSVNSSTFRLDGNSDDSDSTALLAQLWYQLDVGYPKPGQEEALKRFELTVGKMDPFMFFDQNAAADDESTKFLNNVFVHNAQLDSGGDVGADSYGFSPGIRMAWRDESEETQYWQVSAAMFGSGNGSTYDTSFTQPFVIAQAERGLKLFKGLDGTYRAYAWRNGRATDFNGNESAHAGWGLSLDQRLPGGVTLFGRYGHQMSGRVKFNNSLSLGGELSGNTWNRGADALGMAVGWQSTSKAWKNSSETEEGYQASGREKVYEVYYRYSVNPAFELSPDLQYVQNPAGNSSASDDFAYGLRAKVSF